eukprot:CAMPEP_0113279262 /NCGR_PEP_ID=MMETSP0008_2-20120614/27073_1 /TAXON_ID=97485 /ORGANISM="Prymnesium parvum" /LENGTH=93 /DNA_ID=CAMNT_0000129399 /DNA_START=124 /DNA_END=406 /DNA_ORIENTATION=- /assembly_acc=CAM_ASM_000153
MTHTSQLRRRRGSGVDPPPRGRWRAGGGEAHEVPRGRADGGEAVGVALMAGRVVAREQREVFVAVGLPAHPATHHLNDAADEDADEEEGGAQE